MDDKDLRKINYLLHDIVCRLTQLDRRLALMEEGAKRRHSFMMDAVGPKLRSSKPEPMPEDIAEMFRKRGFAD